MWSWFSSPWVTLSQVAEHINQGQLEDAQRLLTPLVEQGYRKAWRLQRRLVLAYWSRAQRWLQVDEVDYAWTDLLTAEALAGKSPVHELVELRKMLSKDGMNEAAVALEAGNPRHATRTIHLLRERGVHGPSLQQLEEVASAWLHAADWADRGDFDEALAALTPVGSLLESVRNRGLKRYEQELVDRRAQFHAAYGPLAAAAQACDWKRVVELADDVLRVAPSNVSARQLRAKAWAQLIPHDGNNETPPAKPPFQQADLHLVFGAISGAAASEVIQKKFYTKSTKDYTDRNSTTANQSDRIEQSSDSTRASATDQAFDHLPLPEQFLLWIDGVGGYLVCTSSQITIGSAASDTPNHLPLFAPLSSLQAEIQRNQAGQYFVVKSRDTTVNGLPAEGQALVNDDVIELARTCKIRFSKSAPGSNTAYLEILSGHRMPWPVNGIYLMDQILILSQAKHTDIALPWEHDNEPEPPKPTNQADTRTERLAKKPRRFVIFRQQDQLELKCEGLFLIDDEPHQNQALLRMPATIVAKPYVFSLEPIGPRV